MAPSRRSQACSTAPSRWPPRPPTARSTPRRITAANQEYQSILSEISNIGSTTTYNQEQVFNSNTSIYTGDSSAPGSSIDDLNIRSLSSSNLGDSGGMMAYSSGSAGNNVFIDLSNNATTQLTDGPVAGINDQLNASGTTSITITTLSSTGTDVANVVSVGGTSGYANTAQGLINAVNSQSQSQGWGVTASFTTAAVAGDTTAGTAATDTGIMITGSVGSGATPSQSSYSGVVAAAGNTSSATTSTKAGGDFMSGSITLQVGTSEATTVTAAQVATANNEASGTVTMAQLASYITANAGLGVTATVNSSTGALDLAASNNSTAALKVTSNLTDNTLKTGTASNETTSYTANSAYSAGVSTSGIKDSNIGNPTLNATNTTITWTDAGGDGAVAAQTLIATGTTNLTGKLTITDGAGGTEKLQLGSVSEGTDTLAHLAATLNTLGTAGGTGGASLGFTAALDGSGNLQITQTGTADGVTSTAPIHFAIAANNAGNTQTAGDTVDTGGASSAGGIATISYSDKAGATLSGTDLSTQQDAESALTSLNTAIADVAAQDGYIGAQINTLNAVSSVLSTQSGKRAVGAERGAGHRLRAGQLQHVEVRNPEPDRHRGPGAGQLATAGRAQAVAITGAPAMHFWSPG